MWLQELILFIQNFLNDNIGVVTFVVGILAIYLYIKQKNDKKIDSASLILQEIRYAEHQIRNYRNNKPNQYSLADRLLPTNSWNDNIHLFIKDLEENELDMISSFYSKVKYVDFLIEKRSEQKISQKNDQKANQTFLNHSINQPQPFQTAQIQTPNGSQQIQQMVEITLPDITTSELVTINLLKQVSFGIELIYHTPVVDKLKKISKKRWFFFYAN